MNKVLFRTLTGYFIAIVLGNFFLAIAGMIHTFYYHADAIMNLNLGEVAHSVATIGLQAKIISFMIPTFIPALFVWLGLKVCPKIQRKRLLLISAAMFLFFPLFMWLGMGWASIPSVIGIGFVGWLK